MKKSLYPKKEVSVNIPLLLVMIIIVAVTFFLIGVATMHYPMNGGLV